MWKELRSAGERKETNIRQVSQTTIILEHTFICICLYISLLPSLSFTTLICSPARLSKWHWNSKFRNLRWTLAMDRMTSSYTLPSLWILKSTETISQSEWIMESKNNMKMLGVKFFVLLQLQHLQSITQKRSSASKWHLTSDTLCCFDLISMQYNAVFCIRPINSPIHGNVKLTFSRTH